MPGHPSRSWTLWAELGGLVVVPVMAGLTVGFALQACWQLVDAWLLLQRIR